MTKSSLAVTADDIAKLRMTSQQFQQRVAGKSRGNKTSVDLDLEVYEIMCSVTMPVTVNEVHAVIAKSRGRTPSSYAVRQALNNLEAVSLIWSREQTDTERQALGMTRGVTPRLYFSDSDIPTRHSRVAIPGVTLKPLPDTWYKKSQKRSKKQRPAKAASTQQTAAPKSAVERHDIAIKEMQGRISSLEAELKRIQQILR
jgi:hypothetical protein